MPGHNTFWNLAESIRQTEIADPGDAGAIEVGTGLCNLVSGASGETRTLGTPDHAGLFMIVNLQTHGGGNCDVTVADSINGAGNTIIAFDAEGDSVILISLPQGTVASATFQWSVFDGTGGPGFS